MTETETGTTASTAAANGAGPAPDGTIPAEDKPNLGERLMFLVMLAAGAGLLFLAVDGLTGYALSRAFARGEDEG